MANWAWRDLVGELEEGHHWKGAVWTFPEFGIVLDWSLAPGATDPWIFLRYQHHPTAAELEKKRAAAEKARGAAESEAL